MTDPTPAQATAIEQMADRLAAGRAYEASLARTDPARRADRLEQPALRHERIMAADPGDRFEVISDVLDETYGPNAGPGNLTHGGFSDPANKASLFQALGFSDQQITTALTDRIDENGWIDTTASTAALAELAETPGGDIAYQDAPAARAYAEAAGYTDNDTETSNDPADPTPRADIVAELAEADDWTSEELDHLATERPDLREQIDDARLRMPASDVDDTSDGGDLVSDAELGAAIQRGLADGSLISYEEFLRRVETDTDLLDDGDRPAGTADEDEISL